MGSKSQCMMMRTATMTNKSAISFEHCSLGYLNQWITYDMKYCAAFETGSKKQQLEQLNKAGGFYRVARNAPTKFDLLKKLQRYEPIIDLFDSLSSEKHKDPIALVNNVSEHISKSYGGTGTLSLTSKFLWIKFKSPIVIYDSQAKKALNFKDNDYKSYFDCWTQEFHNNKDKIQSALKSLHRMHNYTVNTMIGTRQYIQRLTQEKWFHERVFDYYLWMIGS